MKYWIAMLEVRPRSEGPGNMDGGFTWGVAPGPSESDALELFAAEANKHGYELVDIEDLEEVWGCIERQRQMDCELPEETMNIIRQATQTGMVALGTMYGWSQDNDDSTKVT